MIKQQNEHSVIMKRKYDYLKVIQQQSDETWEDWEQFPCNRRGIVADVPSFEASLRTYTDCRVIVRREPVGIPPQKALDYLKGDVDAMIMVKGYDSNEPFLFAGVWLSDFEGHTDEEILKYLSEHKIDIW